MWAVSWMWLGRLVTWPCSQRSTGLDRCLVGLLTPDTMGRPGGLVNVVWTLGRRWNWWHLTWLGSTNAQRQLMSSVCSIVFVEPVDKLVGGLGD